MDEKVETAMAVVAVVCIFWRVAGMAVSHRYLVEGKDLAGDSHRKPRAVTTTLMLCMLEGG